MSVLVEMKVAGWSWALLPKAPHSSWSYQQKSLLFQQWFPWQCSQSRKERGKKKKKKSQWYFKSKFHSKKKMFHSERIQGAYPLQKWQQRDAEHGSLGEGGGTARWHRLGDPEPWGGLRGPKQGPKSRCNPSTDTSLLILHFTRPPSSQGAGGRAEAVPEQAAQEAHAAVLATQT